MPFPLLNRKPLREMEGVLEFVESEPYVDAFGVQWLEWPKTQFDSVTGLPITEIRMKRMFGPLWNDLASKQVLEAGCGAGRFTEILLRRDCFVTAVDLSVAVYANYQIFNTNPCHRVFRASILDLPFEKEQFEVVFCLGVIQHTPNPEETIASLWAQVKPGGWLIYDHYRHNLATWSRTAWIFRLFLKRLKPEMGIRITNSLVDYLLPLHKKFARFRITRILLNRISPITSHHSDYPELDDSQLLAWSRLDTHDNLTDWYKHHTTVKRTRKKIERLGGEIITLNLTQYNIEVLARKTNNK